MCNLTPPDFPPSFLRSPVLWTDLGEAIFWRIVLGPKSKQTHVLDHPPPRIDQRLLCWVPFALCPPTSHPRTGSPSVVLEPSRRLDRQPQPLRQRLGDAGDILRLVAVWRVPQPLGLPPVGVRLVAGGGAPLSPPSPQRLARRLGRPKGNRKGTPGRAGSTQKNVPLPITQERWKIT